VFHLGRKTVEEEKEKPITKWERFLLRRLKYIDERDIWKK
jgi:hypothetical protein